MNKYGLSNKAFLFVCDFDKEDAYFVPADKIIDSGILFSMHSNLELSKLTDHSFTHDLVHKKIYDIAFDKVLKRIRDGETYLLNLTFENLITTNLSLHEIYNHCKAKYKLFIDDQFVVFSPERFVKIENNVIVTNPMKGTSNQSDDSMGDKLLRSNKEDAEHYTIVDLMRNDLHIVANDVVVTKFKYLDLIQRNKGSIWQMSSEIQGKIRANMKNKFGDIFDALLPAGSISGAPKKKTLEIIKEVENYKRNFYTGVFGFFDGKVLESAVMIRFIEKRDNNFFYKAGGGLTSLSKCKEEYNELISKIYLPIF